jgi:hypothetical protein
MEPDDLDLEPMDRGRQKPIIIGIVVVAVAAVIAYVVQSRFKGTRESDEITRTTNAWNELRRCLVGDYLHAGQRASRVVRAIEVGLPRAIEDIAPDEREGQWPFRCATHASVMTHALFEAHTDDANLQMMAALASRAATFLEHGRLQTGTHDPNTYLDELFEVVRRAHLPAGSPPHGPLPPAPVEVLAPTRMTPILADRGAATFVSTDPIVSRTLRVVMGQTDRSVCVFAAGADDASLLSRARCQNVRAAGSPNVVHLLAADDAAPAFLRIGDDGIVNAATRSAVSLPAGLGAIATGYLDADSSLRLATAVAPPPSPTASAWTLTTLHGDDAPVTSTLRAPFADAERTGAPVLVGSQWLVAQSIHAAAPTTAGPDAGAHDASTATSDAGDASTTTHDSVRLYASALPTRANEVATATPIGDAPIAAIDAHISACRTESTLAVVVRGANDASSAITFFEDGHWSAPVVAETARASLSCRAHEVSFTWLETSPHRWIRQVRCTTAGCNESHGSFPTFPGDVLPAVADVDGKVLLLASPGPGHGLVAVYAPVTDLARTDRRVVLDDGDHGGLDIDPRIQIFVRGAAAIALVSATAEPFPTYAIRFDAQGNFRGAPPVGAATP